MIAEAVLSQSFFSCEMPCASSSAFLQKPELGNASCISSVALVFVTRYCCFNKIKLSKILDKKKGYDIKHERQKRNLSRLWDSSVPKTTKSRRRDERKT